MPSAVSTDTYVQYKYRVTEFYVSFGGTVESIPVERISEMKIEHNFETAVFPIFKIESVMSSALYYKIIENKTDVKFKVRIQKFYFKNGTQEKSLDTDVLNDVFIMFPDDNNLDYQKQLRDADGAGKDENSPDRLSNIIEFFLFKESVSGLRSSINAVFSKCEVSSAVAFLLGTAKAKKILVTPFQNKEVYDEIIIPPMPIEKGIRYLANTYGFHKEGSLIYFGLDRGYILSYMAGCTAYEQDEYVDTVIYVYDKANHNGAVSGAFIRNGEKKYYVNQPSDSISIQTQSVSQNVINGVNPTVINMQDNSTKKLTTQSQTVGKSNEKIVYNTTSNKYMDTMVTAQQNASALTIAITLSDVNMEAFTPNKNFSIVFEDTSLNMKYKGKYNIVSAVYTFTNSGDYFDVTAAIVFKKIK